ncbi:hypothetical protein DFQ26_008789 [Actinomortierella ambigua]|nr:hypothetical protein DFQ26_008789 [Actinomortierella ambigua]
MRKARQYLVRKRDEKRDYTPSSSATATATATVATTTTPSTHSRRPQQGPFAPSSFEYQLTASLLALPSPSSTRQTHHQAVVRRKGSQTSFTKRTRRRSRQGPQPYRITIDTSRSAAAATTGGVKHRGGAGGAGVESGSGLSSSRIDGKATAAMLAAEPLAPFPTDDSPPSTWSPSPPASPFSGSGLEGSAFVLRGKASTSALSTTLKATPTTTTAAPPVLLDSLPNMSTPPFPPNSNNNNSNNNNNNNNHNSSGVEATTTTSQTEERNQSPQPIHNNNNNNNSSNNSIPLPPIPPSPPLPPIPPKTLSNLIAQYFPGSLPPPPPRVAGAGPRRGSGIALHAADAKSPPPSSTATPTTTPNPTPATSATSTPTFPPSLYVPRGSTSTSSSPPAVQLDVKTPTFGPAVLMSAENEPPVPTISASTRSALFHMAASMAAAAAGSGGGGTPATRVENEGSFDQGALFRSCSTVGTIATVSTASGSSSPASLHPALVSTSAFGVHPPYPPPSPKHHPGRPYPPPNTTVAIHMPFSLSRMLTTVTTNSMASSSPSTTAAIVSEEVAGTRGRPLHPPRRPSMTPYGSFERRSSTTSATPSSAGAPGTAGSAAASTSASEGSNGGGVGLLYPTALKDTTAACPGALWLGSKLSSQQRYYRAALYNSESSISSSTSSMLLKPRRSNGSTSGRLVISSVAAAGGAGGERGAVGGGRRTSRSIDKGKRRHYQQQHQQRRRRRRKGSDDSLDRRLSSSGIVVVSMTSSELDPLHYIENKPLPTVRRDGIFDEEEAIGLENPEDNGAQRGGCRLLPSFISCSPLSLLSKTTSATAGIRSASTSKTRAQWWVFRDQDGWMVGPWLFLLGFVFPLLWWIGGVYRAKPPKTRKSWPPAPKKKETEIQLTRLLQGVRGGGGSGGSGGKEDETARRDEHKDGSVKTSTQPQPLKEEKKEEEEDPEEDIVSTVLAPPPTKSSHHSQQPSEPSTAMILLDMEQLAKEAAETSGQGPWAVEHKAAMVFQERMARDRRARRAQVEARWRTVNLVFAFLSLVAAVAICAIVITVV